MESVLNILSISNCCVGKGQRFLISKKDQCFRFVPKWPRMAHEGFTLLEMLVSIAVIGVVLVAIFKMQSGTTRLSASGDFYDTAPPPCPYEIVRNCLGAV